MSSAYSAYSGQINSVYSAPVTSIKSDRDSSDDQISTTASKDEINDTADISEEAMNLYNKDKTHQAQTVADKNGSQKTTDSKASTGKSSKELSPQQQQQISKLKSADAEVKAHEQAHISAASGLRTSAPSYQYETGPDGKKYAVSGEVNISFSQTGDPKKDLQMAESLKAAALAPANPSGQDMSVAKQADEMIQQDKQKIQEENQPQTDKAQKTDSTDSKETKTEPEIGTGITIDNTDISDKTKNTSNTKTENREITAESSNNSQPVDGLNPQQNNNPIMMM